MSISSLFCKRTVFPIVTFLLLRDFLETSTEPSQFISHGFLNLVIVREGVIRLNGMRLYSYTYLVNKVNPSLRGARTKDGSLYMLVMTNPFLEINCKTKLTSCIDVANSPYHVVCASIASMDQLEVLVRAVLLNNSGGQIPSRPGK